MFLFPGMIYNWVRSSPTWKWIKSAERKKGTSLPDLKKIKKIEDLEAAFLKAEELGKLFSFKIGEDTYPIKTIVLDGNEKEGYIVLWYVESHILQYQQCNLSLDGTFQFCPELQNRHNHQFYSIMADRQGGVSFFYSVFFF